MSSLKRDPTAPLRFAPNQHIRHRRIQGSEHGDSLELGESFLLTRLTPIEAVAPEDLPTVLARPDMLVPQEGGLGQGKPWEPSPVAACIAIVVLALAAGLVLIYLAYRMHQVH